MQTKIGIATWEQYQKRTMDIVTGKYTPSPNSPKIWFSSLESFAKALKNGEFSQCTGQK